MSYVVLARKWRPQSFEDLVGQEHVSITVGNAIAQNRVAHAFLFTGVRGVGKTTSARILAKALNCASGPSPKPCQVCPQCREITAGNDVDVLEIDGASYNGVDEVRRLQESLPYRPQRDRFKIYIVDEVHMLSNAAWNAFLKTLEEPPPHVKFIFATTEAHKVPVTILSRCQRYDFKLIGAQAIANRLRFVLEKEGIAAEDAAVAVLAREAAGSMRDAMSLLDQAIAWIGVESEGLTAEGVARVLGVAGREVLYRLSEAVIGGDAATSVRIVGELAQQGYDLPHVARDFLAHLRDLVIAKVAEDPAALLDLAEDELADVKALAARADLDDLTRLHQGFSRAFDDIVRSGQPRASLEMALVRLSRRPPLLPIDELLHRLEGLERRLTGSAPSPGASGARGASQGSSAPNPPRRPSGGAMSQDAGSLLSPRPLSTASRSPPELPSRAAPIDPEPPTPTPAPSLPSANGSFAPACTLLSPTGLSTGTTQTPPAMFDLSGWRKVLDTLRARHPALGSLLDHAAVLAFGRERVTLGFETGSFLIGQVADTSTRDLVSTALDAYFGGCTELTFETISAKLPSRTLAALDSGARTARLDATRRAVAGHPLVAAAVELLGAELKDVRLADADG
jgi:DNA polymerase-3 subunit gamma/tau